MADDVTMASSASRAEHAQILIVGNEIARRDSLMQGLQLVGYSVITAKNGEEALERAAQFCPNLMVINPRLSDMSEAELCSRLRQNPQLAAMVILQVSTGTGMPIDRVHGLQEGADAHLTEPLQANELLATIHALLRMKEAEEKAYRVTRESAAQFRQLADSMPQMVWSMTPDGTPDFFNQRSYEFLGVDATRLDSIVWQEHIHADDRGKVHQAFQDAFIAGEPYEVEYRLLHADGKYRSILERAVPVRDEKQIVVKWYGSSTDVSPQVERENFLRQILNSSTDCIKVLDETGHMVSVNAAGAKILELDKAEDCRKMPPWIDFWSGEDRDRAWAAMEKARRGETVTFEGFCATRSGVPKWWEVIMTRLENYDGKPPRILTISRDITERRQAAERLAQAARDAELARDAAEAANSSKTDFLANISHEIRTPMNVVIGLANLLATTGKLTAKQTEYVQTMQISANSLLALINDLLDISKIEAGSMEIETIAFSYYDLVQDVVKVMQPEAEAKHLAFSADLAVLASLDFIGDPTRIRQILTNLCSNALKFTATGAVRIWTEKNPHSAPGLFTVDIHIQDTGPGIPPEKQKSIFEKFTQADSSITRKFGGTGLGLTISKTLAEAMGGEIRLVSVPGQGATFTLSLPLRLMAKPVELQAQRNTAPVASAPPALVRNESSSQLLLVEDHPPNILIASTVLETLGYQVDTAMTGVEAIDKAQSGTYEAIIMDVQMPGMDGLQATRTIRDRETAAGKRHIPIIGMTAHALAGDREKCLHAGMNDYISKPFEINDLQKALRNVASK